MKRGTFLPFARPLIGEDEIAEVVDSLRSGWITTGPKVKRFEAAFADYIGARHAVAVSSCTAGLHVALAALGIGPGDEVIVPSFTFCSTANVVVHLGARPVLVDVRHDFNIAPQAVLDAITPRTKAIMPVHHSGQACDLGAIYEIARQHNLAVVEDAAHAAGTSYKGSKIGSLSLFQSMMNGSAVKSAAAFSFYATKNMTTGEGGMIAVNDDDLAKKMRLLSLHGMSLDAWKRYSNSGSWYYEVVLPGYKSNMTDIQASLGLHQLRRLDNFIEARQRYAKIFDEAFAELDEIQLPITHPERNHVYHLYVIRLNLERLLIDRSQFVEELRKRNIGTSVHFIPVHLHPFYREHFGYRKGDLPTAEHLYDRIISLPLYPSMTDTDVQDVITAVAEITHAFRGERSIPEERQQHRV